MAKGGGELVGRRVLVPRSVWPNEKPPKGATGWTGRIKSRRSTSPETYFVVFPGDPASYYFGIEDIERWLLPAGETPAPPSAARPGSAARTGGSRGAVTPAAAGRSASPSKKRKAPAVHAAADEKKVLKKELMTVAEELTAPELRRTIAFVKAFFEG